MNRIIAAVMLSALIGGCANVESDENSIIATPQEQLRVLSETVGKGPKDSLDAAERASLALAQETLATHLNNGGNNYPLVTIQAVEWADSSLGCPQPRQSYLSVITPGYRVVLLDGAQRHRVHTGNGVAIVCKDAGPEPFQRPSQPISARAIERMRLQARQDLAQQFGVGVDEIEFGMLVPSRWPDASLGCPVDGVAYPPGVRSGFRIPLKYHDRTVFYHTDGQRVFPCPPIARD